MVAVLYVKPHSGNMLGGDLGEIVSLQPQTSPCFQLREKFKCIEHIGKGEPSLKLVPEIAKSEGNRLPVSDT